jgi:hypothetical protein
VVTERCRPAPPPARQAPRPIDDDAPVTRAQVAELLASAPPEIVGRIAIDLGLEPGTDPGPVLVERRFTPAEVEAALLTGEI